MAKPAQLSSGDLFAVPIAPGEVLEGRVVLDIAAQCIRPRRVATSSPLAFYGGALLVEVRRGDELVISGKLVHADTWPTTGHRDVVPEAVDFAQALIMHGTQPEFVWGEVTLPLAITVQELRAIDIEVSISPAATLPHMSLYSLGRVGEIDRSFYKVPEQFAPGHYDIRASPHAARIRELLGTRINDSYFATALRYGYDVRRFYEAEPRELLLCPFCQAPIERDTAHCPTCGNDVRNDAPDEMTNVELALARRIKCRACSGPMVDGSVVCPGCKTDQYPRRT